MAAITRSGGGGVRTCASKASRESGRPINLAPLRPYRLTLRPADQSRRDVAERKFCIDSLLVPIHLIIEMILEDRLCAMGIWIPFFV